MAAGRGQGGQEASLYQISVLPNPHSCPSQICTVRHGLHRLQDKVVIRQQRLEEVNCDYRDNLNITQLLGVYLPWGAMFLAKSEVESGQAGSPQPLETPWTFLLKMTLAAFLPAWQPAGSILLLLSHTRTKEMKNSATKKLARKPQGERKTGNKIKPGLDKPVLLSLPLRRPP